MSKHREVEGSTKDTEGQLNVPECHSETPSFPLVLASPFTPHATQEHKSEPTEVNFFRGKHILKVAASQACSVVMEASCVYVFGAGVERQGFGQGGSGRPDEVPG